MEDPSLGPFDPAQIQIHDFNPGDLNPPGYPNYFLDGGLFWTMPLDRGYIKVHPGRGDASFAFDHLETQDWINVVNALFRPSGFVPIPATMSVYVAWHGTGERASLHNADLGFGGNYENATADVQWKAYNDDGYWLDTTGSTEVNLSHAFTCKIRNGAFYP